MVFKPFIRLSVSGLNVVASAFRFDPLILIAAFSDSPCAAKPNINTLLSSSPDRGQPLPPHRHTKHRQSASPKRCPSTQPKRTPRKLLFGIMPPVRSALFPIPRGVERLDRSLFKSFYRSRQDRSQDWALVREGRVFWGA